MEGGRGGGEGNAEVNNNNGSQEKADQKKQKVAFYKLFSFADRLDVALMIVGTISAVGNGLSKPLMTLVFGNLINTFGCTDPGHIVPMISKVSLKFVYLAIGTGAAALLQVACWMVTGERQAARIRGKYMKAILRQDIGFFDTETSTGEIIGRMSGDTILIQEAMGEKASPSLNAFASGKAAAYKMFETISRNPTIDPYDTSGIVLQDVKGDVELKDVYFRYPARPDVQIFAEFSLYVPSGTTTALVGQSGSGKSTVIGLVERFYDPEAGEVLIDGVDLKKLQLKAIREKIGLVSQEPNLFTTTIRENIKYGKDDATDEEIRRATELANAAKFIDRLPQGIDAMVGEHGTSLSGGQKQRIAIARAILKNPRILLLDEATSALDAESEKIVQDALVNLMSNRTTIVVAHRLTTIRNADCIAVVHKGKLVEKGTHDELARDPEGAYSQLIHLQEGSKVDNGAQTSDPNRVDTSLDIDRTMLSSASRRLSMRRSISRGSSGGRHSFTVGFGIPGPIDVQENEVGHEDDHDRPKVDPEKRNTVSIRRLAALNKPEVPVLLLGAIAAAGHGVLFPIFGLLLSKAIGMFYEPPNELRHDSRKWALVYVGLGCAGLLVVPVQNFFFGVAGGKLVERIRALSFQKVVHQQVSWFDDPTNSRYVKRNSNFGQL
ncbi:hypothetical protein C1H46_013649 [Malus baccata]|uniref:ABC transporter domain-containing protein n=1 Tax=Malus baccata TaxID=106549 RepID=A0A540MQS1_MALBA|nr:hypothetical protein C1H46_013649 [Malus baccata]